ncbi:helix-turn-helix domain-containing protein [uncultured Paraglaciecola sp.]|uniref:helix-turn-helix domain-containing protein n=1 Tax=uncultured Paraglaciecola sp. TaxID=1765024 RepID=UPI0026052204|nr:helix-turn-helix domain-containing protein [uncultured Paraglaciecola sp.]
MHKTQILLKSIGELVKNTRSTIMDQAELGTRVGVGRNTISSIENGKSVNAQSLFLVLEHLDIIDDLQAAIEQQQNNTTSKLSRKSRKPVAELDNDF